MSDAQAFPHLPHVCRCVIATVDEADKQCTRMVSGGFRKSKSRDCEVIKDGERVEVLPIEWHGTLDTDRKQFGAFWSSGEQGTNCDTYLSQIDSIENKHIRYPWHIKFGDFFHE